MSSAPWQYPVKADTFSFNIVDARGEVMIPAINYRSDIYFITKQKELLSLLEKTLNNAAGWFWSDSLKAYHKTDVPQSKLARMKA